MKSNVLLNRRGAEEAHSQDKHMDLNQRECFLGQDLGQDLHHAPVLYAIMWFCGGN